MELRWMEEPHTINDELDLLFLFFQTCTNIVVRHIVRFPFLFPGTNGGVCLFQKETFNFMRFSLCGTFNWRGVLLHIYLMHAGTGSM